MDQSQLENVAFLMDGFSILINLCGFKLYGFVADGAHREEFAGAVRHGFSP